MLHINEMNKARHNLASPKHASNREMIASILHKLGSYIKLFEQVDRLYQRLQILCNTTKSSDDIHISGSSQEIVLQRHYMDADYNGQERFFTSTTRRSGEWSVHQRSTQSPAKPQSLA